MKETITVGELRKWLEAYSDNARVLTLKAGEESAVGLHAMNFGLFLVDHNHATLVFVREPVSDEDFGITHY